LTKALWDVGHVARIILDLNWLKENFTAEAAVEGDDSPQPSKLQAIIGELCEFLNALVAEETNEILNDAELAGEPQGSSISDIMVMAAGGAAAAHVANLSSGRSPKLQKFAAEIFAKVKHSDGDQALLDLACHALDKCMGMDRLLFAERSHVAQAREALQAAGGASVEATVDTAFDPETRPPMVRPPAPEFRPGRNSTRDSSMHYPSGVASGVMEMIATVLGKRGGSHQALIEIAHDCLSKLTDGACCMAAKAGTRHSKETLGHFAKAHDHLVAAGAKCDAAGSIDEADWQEADFERGKVAVGNLSKILAGERAEKAALIATLTDIVPRLDQLTKRVEDIARTPLPPLAVAKNVTAISKQQDAGGGFSPDDLAAAFSRMSNEEQTLTLIKASYARPIQPNGLAMAKEVRGE
jgi:hypothetical protein